MSNTRCKYCEKSFKGLYLNCPRCGKYLMPYGKGPDLPPEPYELAEGETE